MVARTNITIIMIIVVTTTTRLVTTTTTAAAMKSTSTSATEGFTTGTGLIIGLFLSSHIRREITKRISSIRKNSTTRGECSTPLG